MLPASLKLACLNFFSKGEGIAQILPNDEEIGLNIEKKVKFTSIRDEVH